MGTWKFCKLSKGKGNFSERAIYRRLKLTDQILKTTDRIIEKLRGRQQVDIYKMQLGFMPRSGTTNAIFILRQLQEKYLAKKTAFVILAFVDLKKSLIERLWMLYGGL